MKCRTQATWAGHGSSFGREAGGVLAEGVDLGEVDALDQIAAGGEVSV